MAEQKPTDQCAKCGYLRKDHIVVRDATDSGTLVHLCPTATFHVIPRVRETT